MTETAELPPASERLRALEAMLFVSPGPVRLSELCEATGWDAKLVERDLDQVAVTLEGHGIELQRVAGALRLVTSPSVAPYVEKLIGVQTRRRLTRAQLETLAVVAYRQPATRAIVEAARGVSCERLLAQLTDLRLIREVGRAELPGRPLLYGTTADFLRYFSINKLEQLPDLRDLRKTVMEGVSASQASWNSVSRGDAEAPAGFDHTDITRNEPVESVQAQPEESHRFGTMNTIADELANSPSQGLRKLLSKIRGKQQAS